MTPKDIEYWDKNGNKMYQPPKNLKFKHNKKEKVAQYEDWNNRLQEFMDMSDEDRIKYVENLRRTNELDSLLKKFGFFNEMFGGVFM